MRNPGLTHTGRMRGQYHADEQAVLFFTGMSKEELTDLKLDMAKRWLVRFCEAEYGLSEAQCESMWLEPELLRWWNLHWRRFDHWYVLPMLHKIVEGERENVYLELHASVFDRQHPQHTLMQTALRKLIEETAKSTQYGKSNN